jgi:ATP-dependent protease HslVU (ClpYQ) peptidase subunit
MMTCIVGIERNGKCYLGGDRAGSDDWSIEQVTEPKIFKVNDLIIGYTSSFRFGQLIQYQMPEVKVVGEMPDIIYLSAVVAKEIRKLLKDDGYAAITNNEEVGGIALIGFNGKIYRLQGDYSVVRSGTGFNAVGSGDMVAKGAMHAMGPKCSAKRAMVAGLGAASDLVPSVSGPFDFIDERGRWL